MAKKQNKQTNIVENPQRKKFFPESTGSVFLDILRSIFMLIGSILKLVLRLLLCIIYFGVGFGLYYLPPMFPSFGIPQIDLFDGGLISIIYLCVGVGLFVICLGSAFKKKAEIKNKKKREAILTSLPTEITGEEPQNTVLRGVDVNGDGVPDFFATIPAERQTSTATPIATMQPQPTVVQSIPVQPVQTVVQPVQTVLQPVTSVQPVQPIMQTVTAFQPQPTVAPFAGAPMQPIAGIRSVSAPSSAPISAYWSQREPNIYIEDYEDCYKRFTVSEDGKTLQFLDIQYKSK